MNTPVAIPRARPHLAPGAFVAAAAAALLTLVPPVTTVFWVATRIVVLYVFATR